MLDVATTCPTTDDFWRSWLAQRVYFRRMCIRWLRGNRQDADDVLSRGSLRALEFLRGHPGGVEKFRPWVLRILRNLCHDARLAASRCVEPAEGHDGESEEVACGGVLPDQVIYREQLRAAITGAVDGLPERLSTAFCLRYVDDLEYTELCCVLDITPENARKRVQQARARLRERLARVA